MTERPQSTAFHKGIPAWLCEGYACEIRYLVHKNIVNGRNELLFATIKFGWKLNVDQEQVHKNVPNLIAGVNSLGDLKIAQLREILDLALKGEIAVNGDVYSLSEGQVKLLPPIEYREAELELSTKALQCRVVPAPSGSLAPTPQLDIFTPELDAELQKGKHPFTNFRSLVDFLSLPDPRFRNTSAEIIVTIEPPGDFEVAESHWEDDRLLVKVYAHKSFNWRNAQLLLRDLPGGARSPMKPFSDWDDIYGEGKIQRAFAPLTFPGVHEVIADLVIGGVLASRRMFSHPKRADNPRYLAMTECDNELEMLFEFLFKPDKGARKSKKERDSRQYERAVAALLYLRGFNSVIPMNTDAVDIVATTPAGRWMVVECSLSLDDIREKAGKLVRRREALRVALGGSYQVSELVACLVCPLTRAELGKPDDYLTANEILLWTDEDVKRECAEVKHLGDPDRQFLEAAKSLSAGALLAQQVANKEDAPSPVL